MKMRKIDIGEVEGFRIGNAENVEAGTGVTVIISEDGAVAGVDVRGGGPATRETDLLRSENTVDKINAVVLSGGSAFGLEAASGVMRRLAEQGIGFKALGIPVPIVAGASLFDLPVGRSDIFPDIEMGREAVDNAFAGVFSAGNHGAGTGATVGKSMGMDRCMKSGIGTFACGDDCVQVGAIAAVNAIGDIYNGAGNIIAGLRTSDGSAIQGTIRVLKGMIHEESKPEINLSDIKTMAASEVITQQSSNVKADDVNTLEQTGSQTARNSEDDEMSDIVRAMMKSYEEENNPAMEAAPEAVSEAEIPAESLNETITASITEAGPADESSAAQSASESVPDSEYSPEDIYLQLDAVGHEDTVSDSSSNNDIVPDAADAPEVPETSEMSPVEDQVEDQAEDAAEPDYDEDDGYNLTEEDKADLGYDIPFNTTISCVITNAKMTKPQANKLASILHDAYARAIKPVHSTLDGDTVFVMSTCTQEVNFDAFAALATDVLQYAIIDGASSAEGAYGIPASRDIIRK